MSQLALICGNGALPAALVDQVVALDASGMALMRNAAEKLKFTAN